MKHPNIILSNDCDRAVPYEFRSYFLHKMCLNKRCTPERSGFKNYSWGGGGNAIKVIEFPFFLIRAFYFNQELLRKLVEKTHPPGDDM